MVAPLGERTFDIHDASEQSIARADEVDAARYRSDLEFIADTRTSGSVHWQAVQDRCAEVFEASGFTVERHEYGTGVNVIGVLPGTQLPEEYVVVSGHYDHIPGCIGADDNASGTAGVLEAARVLGGDHLYERTLVVACWDEEEAGLIGANAWADRAERQGHTVHAAYVLETMAYHSDESNSQSLPLGFGLFFAEAAAFVADRDNRGDFIAAVGDDINPSATDEFIAHSARVELPVAKVMLNAELRTSPGLSDLRRSDHDAFWRRGWPGIMLTDTANFRNPYYHCRWGQDTVDTLNLDFAVKVVRATIGAAANQAMPTAEGTRGALDTTTDPSPPAPPICDPLLQAGCDAGMKCSRVYEEAGLVNRCVDVAAVPVAVGETCVRPTNIAGIDDCDVDGFCAFWNVSLGDPQARICHKFCASDGDCPATDACIQLSGAKLPLGLCSPVCDPRAPADVCPTDTVCIHVANIDPGHHSFYCTPAIYGDVAAREPCDPERCQAGLSCIPEAPGRESRCMPYCDLDADCATDEECVTLGADRPSSTFGRCVPK